MRRVLLFITFSCLWFSSYAQYTTPGSGVNWDFNDLVNQSGGAVTMNADTFLVNEELIISSPDTVRIEEAIIVKVEKGKEITVQGVWLAMPQEEALFTAMDTANRFSGFRFENSPASIFRNCIIEYAGGIQLVESDMEIVTCELSYFSKENSTGAIDLYHSDALIMNNNIYSNAGPAIASGANGASSPQVYYNSITKNNTSNANTPQINLGTMGNDTIRIVGNTISGLYPNAGGIAISTLMGGQIDVIIDSNFILNNRYGITCYGNNIFSQITRNEILDNNIDNNPMTGGSGINFFGDETNTSMVSRNLISGNLWGITIQNSAQPNIGEMEEELINIGLNDIYNNGNSGEVYDLYNNTPNPIMAENNYWGTYDTDTVEMHIFHQNDDESLGFVDYMPIYKDDVSTEELKAPSNELIYDLFPVPADDQLTFKIREHALVSILDLTGKTKMEKRFNKGQVTINSAQWPGGIYLLTVYSEGRKSTRRIVISHQ